MTASIMPAPPPAIRFTAAPAGALPSLPCTLVAMIFWVLRCLCGEGGDTSTACASVLRNTPGVRSIVHQEIVAGRFDHSF